MLAGVAWLIPRLHIHRSTIPVLLILPSSLYFEMMEMSELGVDRPTS